METFEQAFDLGWDVIESGTLLFLDSTDGLRCVANALYYVTRPTQFFLL
jgi:hypothetical protein